MPASTVCRSNPLVYSSLPCGRVKRSARCVPADIWGRGCCLYCSCRNSCPRYLPRVFHPGAAHAIPRGKLPLAALCIPPGNPRARSVRPCRNHASRNTVERSRSNVRFRRVGFSERLGSRRKGWCQGAASYAVYLAGLGGHDTVKFGVPWEVIDKGQDDILKEQQSFARCGVGDIL